MRGDISPFANIALIRRRERALRERRRQPIMANVIFPEYNLDVDLLSNRAVLNRLQGRWPIPDSTTRVPRHHHGMSDGIAPVSAPTLRPTLGRNSNRTRRRTGGGFTRNQRPRR